MVTFLRRWLRLPSPVDLGWSTDDALMLREFTPYQDGKSWEDWHEHCRKHYPAQYFLVRTLPFFLKRWIVWPAERMVSTVLDYCLPSRRHHVFDLRGIDPLSDYQHGYLDPCQVFWLAGWGALLRWNREAGCKDPRDGMLEGDQEQYRAQLESYDELKGLVHYWTVTRVERDKCNRQLYNAAVAITPTPPNRELYEAAQRSWLDHCWETERLEEDMWLRLAKMRSYLWD